jgi:hypothetical protein
MDYLEMFDTVPCGEKCSDLLSEQRAEARRYKDLIQKLLPAPEGAELRIKSNPHDFGTYATLEAYGDANSDAHWEWVNKISELGETWEELEAAVAALEVKV